MPRMMCFSLGSVKRKIPFRKFSKPKQGPWRLLRRARIGKGGETKMSLPPARQSRDRSVSQPGARGRRPRPRATKLLARFICQFGGCSGRCNAITEHAHNDMFLSPICQEENSISVSFLRIRLSYRVIRAISAFRLSGSVDRPARRRHIAERRGTSTFEAMLIFGRNCDGA
jgi:hypothetical protein